MTTEEGKKSGSVRHFWRGARRTDRRWWGSLAEPPPRQRRPLPLGWLVLAFLAGAAGTLALIFAPQLIG